VSQSTDSFDNPLYDALLKKVHEDVDAFMMNLEKDWSEALIREYRNKYPDLGSVPDKPPPVVASVIWENELRSSIFEVSNDDRKKLIRQPVGFVDLSIIYYEQLLTEEFGEGDEVSWYVTRSHQPSVLHLLCRPALASMAQTAREINRFRNRINEEQYDRRKIGTEYFGILTCNPGYQEIAQSQDIRYICFDENTFSK
jgi:hypothetical protein